MDVINGLRQERDGQDEDDGDHKEDDGEVEVVHLADDGRALAGEDAAARAVGKLGHHPRQADQQADHQAPEGPLRREAAAWGGAAQASGSASSLSGAWQAGQGRGSVPRLAPELPSSGRADQEQ